MQSMYYIGLDVHKRTISYCVQDGRVAQVGIGFSLTNRGESVPLRLQIECGARTLRSWVSHVSGSYVGSGAVSRSTKKGSLVW
jgi:hypothetical protein